MGLSPTSPTAPMAKGRLHSGVVQRGPTTVPPASRRSCSSAVRGTRSTTARVPARPSDDDPAPHRCSGDAVTDRPAHHGPGDVAQVGGVVPFNLAPPAPRRHREHQRRRRPQGLQERPRCCTHSARRLTGSPCPAWWSSSTSSASTPARSRSSGRGGFGFSVKDVTRRVLRPPRAVPAGWAMALTAFTSSRLGRGRGASRRVEGDGRRYAFVLGDAEPGHPLRARAPATTPGHAQTDLTGGDAGARSCGCACPRRPSGARVGSQHHRRWHQARVHAR